MTVFLAPAMNSFDAKTVLVGCQVLNVIGSFLFISTKVYWILLAARILNGVAQAFICAYAPVWINEFAPKTSSTIWMAYMQLFSILGSLFGSIIGSIAADHKDLGIEESEFNWRHTFMLQGGAYLKIGICWFCTKNEILDT